MTELVRRYGLRAARRIWQMSQESVHELVTLLTTRRIACDLQKRDAIYYATDAEAVGRLRQEWTLRTRTGFDAAWLALTCFARSPAYLASAPFVRARVRSSIPIARVWAFCAPRAQQAPRCSNARESSAS